MRKINKSGKVNGGVVALVLVLLLIAGGIFYGIFALTNNTQSTIDIKTGGGSASGCTVNPSVVSVVSDTLNPGTTVTATNNYRLNGVFLGTTSPTVKGSADILYNASGYISNIKVGNNIDCNPNLISNNMYAYANASLTYYSDNGLTALVQATANETVKSAGGSYNWKLHFQGTDKKSTGKMLLIVELSTPANISSVSLNGGTVVAVPNGYSKQLTNGYTVAYLLPAVTGNTAVDYNLAVASATGKVVTGQVYTTVYGTEPFVETDGSFSDVGNAFNSLNTAKYHDVYTKNFIIA